MKLKLISIVAVASILTGCASFSTNVFRTEQTATHMVYTAYVGYTNALPLLNLTPQQSNDVRTARLQFAATVKTVESMRLEYATNSAVKPVLQNLANTMLDQSSNVVWLINFYRGGK